MKKLKTAIAACLCLAAITAWGDNAKKERWLDPSVNRVNVEPSRANFFAFENSQLAKGADKAASSLYLNAEGKWKFNFVKDHNKRPLNFQQPGFDDSKWVDFEVPGLFETHGYGDATYKNIGYAWATQFEPNPPISKKRTTTPAHTVVSLKSPHLGKATTYISTSAAQLQTSKYG